MGKKPMFDIKLGFYRKNRFFAHPMHRGKILKHKGYFYFQILPCDNHVYGILTFSCFKKVLCLVIFHLITDPTLLGKNLKIAFSQNGFVKFF